MKPIFLNSFQIVKPRNHLKQSDLLGWIIRCHQLADQKSGQNTGEDLIQKLFQRYGVKESQISERYFECDDITSGVDFDQAQIYRINDDTQTGVDITARTRFFAERAFDTFKLFYDLKSKQTRPDHIIHVTCTGYISPSAPQQIVIDENWNHSTAITHAYHMGCYASLPAVRLAKSLVTTETDQAHFKVDIVHNEMCGLHMNPLLHSPEQIVVQTLFADGHVKYTASAQPDPAGKNLKIRAVHEKVIPDSGQDMSWIPAPWGMQMNLSREVPTKIQQQLKIFTKELFEKAGVSHDVAMKSLFAIHPGGPQIIAGVQQALELQEDQVSECKKILFERGNMSSATLPHVWDEILNKNYPVGTLVVSYAFGPGLTMFGSVFEIC